MHIPWLWVVPCPDFREGVWVQGKHLFTDEAGFQILLSVCSYQIMVNKQTLPAYIVNRRGLFELQVLIVTTVEAAGITSKLCLT